ncbi:MAG: hypothetical protein IKU84_05970 [Clostridia bacterium]|nr:hypothetical protein [Clostridia bacterium]
MESGFFLGANSKHGFYSLYDNLIDLKRAKCVYIIKGSPGCGKSSFMRKIKTKLEEKFHVEQIFCSLDSNSLDAILIDELGIAFVDGTSPHVVEPKFPMAVERYVNLGDFADADALSDKKSEIIDITAKYKSGFERIYNFLSVAGAIESEIFDIALGGVDINRIKKKAVGIISREITKHGSGGNVKKRFLSSISADGYATNFATISDMADNVYVLEDNFGLGAFLLAPIADAARDAGFDTILCYSPLTPSRLEHLIIPELKLAFVTSKKSDGYTGVYKRKVRLDALINQDILRDKKKKISFSRKLLHATINEACTALKDSKLIHDEIEALYNPHIDFDGVYALADKIANEII